MQDYESGQGLQHGNHASRGVHRTLSAGLHMGQQHSMQSVLRGQSGVEAGPSRGPAGQGKHSGQRRQGSSGSLQSMRNPTHG